MTTESWQPVQAASTIDETSTAKLLELAQQFTQNQMQLASEDMSWCAQLAQAKHDAWVNFASELKADALEHCIRLLTVVEQEQNLGLAERSPVIVLFKQHKKLSGINRDLVQWVKAHTENKFLPFGPIM